MILFRVLLLYSVILNLMMLQDVEGIGHPKLNIACKNAPLSKSFDMGKKSKLWIRSVYYYLKRRMEARFSQITTSVVRSPAFLISNSLIS